MASLSPEIFDIRTLERYLKDGTISQEQYDTFLAGLEDCSDNLEHSNIQMQLHRRPRTVHLSMEEEEN